MSNALHNQSSPYLKEACEQPVNWQAWSKDAFEQAKKLDKPVIVAIGYASCHWCKQMSRDNYEDSYIASIMNRHFICIKVDREERPDLDLFYMEASRMFNQSAGWPLHAFCLPDGAPFWCGTYFPKEDKGQGIAPWPQVLLRIAEHFRQGREELEENGKNALANLAHSNNANLSDPRDWNKESLITAGQILIDAHDDDTGGFTPAPKFPSPMKMDFLFALGESNTVRKNPHFSNRLNFCLQKTLGSMAGGGLFDHVNGGFFRYCLDRQWESPHFEKMLSDNALLVSTYSRAWRKFQNPQDRQVIEKTLAWIERDMGSPQSGYASSLSSEMDQMEGAYYLWTHQELVQAIGSKDAEEMEKLWGPFAQTTTELYFPKFSKDSNLPLDKQSQILQKLHEARAASYKPERDEKKSCAQHALLVRAYIDAGLALGDMSLLARAKKLLHWMESVFLLPDGSVASLLYPDQSRSSFGFLEDYAYWVEAILSFSAISEVVNQGKMKDWIEKAEARMSRTVELCKDQNLPGYFSSPERMENAGPVRKKSWYDHAMPSGNSSLLRCFSILGEIGSDSAKWRAEYTEALGGYPKLIKQSPDGIGHALCAQTEQTVGIVQINGPINLIEKVAKTMTHLSHRPVYFTEDKELALWINRQKVELNKTDHRKLIEILWQ
ncbi:MAG: DUF255 domain-containing protein [Opitutae bacterium]